MACAHHLAAHGADVKVFDKGRRLGGRLATRIQDGFAFNHGAPWFAAHDAGFKHFIEHFEKAGSAARRSNANGSDFVGIPYMNSLLHPLTADVDVSQEIEISALERRGRNWHLTTFNGQVLGAFDAVAVCIPAPQTQKLISALKPDWHASLSSVEYTPCLTAMAVFDNQISEYLDRFSNEVAGKHPAIAQCIRQTAGDTTIHETNLTRWVIHATSIWSARNIEREGIDIAKDLIQQALLAIGQQGTTPIFAHGHRWRYSQVQTALEKTCLWDASAQLGLAGDWCLGHDVQGAYLSGSDLAAKLIASRSLKRE